MTAIRFEVTDLRDLLCVSRLSLGRLLLVLSAMLCCGTVRAEPRDLVHMTPDIYAVTLDEEGPPAVKHWGNNISAAMGFRDYKKLEQWCDDFTGKKQRLLDGKWLIDLYNGGFGLYFSGVTARYDDWKSDYAKIEEWEKRFPDSRCAPIEESEYWIRYAWQARGGGYSDTVTPEGWKLFKQRLGRARDVLQHASTLADVNPVWFTQMLSVAQYLNWPRDRMLTLAYRATDRYPGYFQASLNMGQALTPKWGGSWDAVRAFAMNMVRRTHFSTGMAMYTRIYWQIAAGEPNAFAPRGGIVDWDMMNAGFRALREQQPRSDWILNNFAAFACRAGDPLTYASLRKQITGDTYYVDAWPGGHSMDVCDLRMAYDH